MSLSRSELEHLSLVYYIKEGMLAREFGQEVQDVSLIYDTNYYQGQQRTDYKIIDPSGPFGVLPGSKGRGLLSFELNEINPCEIFDITTSSYIPTYSTPFMNQSYSISTERESTIIKVKDQNGNLMDRSWYDIDYARGRIRFPLVSGSNGPGTPSGVVSSGLVPSKIDYKFHMVSVLNGWPTQEDLPPLPIVAIYPEKEKSPEGFQIGPGVEFSRQYSIDIFATSPSNRRNMIDTIVQGLHNKHAPVIDFNRSGQPLTHWGVINRNFIQEVNFNGNLYRTYLTLNPGNGNILYFLNVEVFYDTSPRSNMSVSTRHMGKIKVSTCTYTDRDPQLIGKFNMLESPPGGTDSLIQKGNLA